MNLSDHFTIKWFLFYCIIINAGCGSSQKKFNSQGLIESRAYFWGATPNRDPNKPPTEVICKIWIKNNRSIQEVVKLTFPSDTAHYKEATVDIYKYTYLSPDLNVAFDYLHFADTASIIKSYRDMDSARMFGAYNHYSNLIVPKYTSVLRLNDTIIDRIKHQRVRLIQLHQDSLYFDLYTRCDLKKPLIKLYNPISDSLGCPIIRCIYYVQNRLGIDWQLKYISDTLSKQELKIFKNWQSNERKWLEKYRPVQLKKN